MIVVKQSQETKAKLCESHFWFSRTYCRCRSQVADHPDGPGGSLWLCSKPSGLFGSCGCCNLLEPIDKKGPGCVGATVGWDGNMKHMEQKPTWEWKDDKLRRGCKYARKIFFRIPGIHTCIDSELNTRSRLSTYPVFRGAPHQGTCCLGTFRGSCHNLSILFWFFRGLSDFPTKAFDSALELQGCLPGGDGFERRGRGGSCWFVANWSV